MAKFKNITTGNIIRVKNEAAIALIKKSENYAPVAENAKGKKQDNKPADNGKSEGEE